MEENEQYCVLAFYRFTLIEDPAKEVREHQKFFSSRDITSRIYLSHEGINGQMSASPQAAKEYIEWMQAKAPFAEIHFKVHYWHEHVFPRKQVKYRKRLVGSDESVDISQQATHVAPDRWKEMLEDERDYLLLDVRNDYEWKLGHFEGAEQPRCDTYRDFERYAMQLKEEMKENPKPIMMYCTGGIRCELYSSLLRQKGFEEIYQLQGGVINYGLEQGAKHWKGKLFVFDDRLSVPISDEAAPIVGQCHFCKTESEEYYNCANIRCNELFLCCHTCLTEHKGCCGVNCRDEGELRPFSASQPHKPFRKKHHYN